MSPTSHFCCTLVLPALIAEILIRTMIFFVKKVNLGIARIGAGMGILTHSRLYTYPYTGAI